MDLRLWRLGSKNTDVDPPINQNYKMCSDRYPCELRCNRTSCQLPRHWVTFNVKLDAHFE